MLPAQAGSSVCSATSSGSLPTCSAMPRTWLRRPMRPQPRLTRPTLSYVLLWRGSCWRHRVSASRPRSSLRSRILIWPGGPSLVALALMILLSAPPPGTPVRATTSRILPRLVLPLSGWSCRSQTFGPLNRSLSRPILVLWPRRLRVHPRLGPGVDGAESSGTAAWPPGLRLARRPPRPPSTRLASGLGQAPGESNFRCEFSR